MVKYGAKHPHGSSNRIHLPSLSVHVCPRCNHLLHFFSLKMILFPAESATKNIYLTCETICIFKGPSSTDSKSFGNVARTIEIKLSILE